MSKFVVCPACGGEGDQDNLGAFTSTDLDEWYGDSDERDEFLNDYKAGMYRVRCDWCKGKRVVPAVSEDGFTAEEEWQDHLECLAMERAEMRYGGGW